MNLPALMLAAAVMFWGWQSGHWWLAAAAAALFEAPRIIHLRFEISKDNLDRLANGCTLFFVGLAVYMYFSAGAAQAVIGTLEWTPLVVSPLFLALAWSGMKKLDLSVVSASLRRRARADSSAARQADLGYPYAALWVLAASLANRQGPGFYAGLLVLIAWALWRIRPAGGAPLAWGAALLAAAIGGGLIHTGLHGLQDVIEENAVDWITGDSEEDPERASTSLGHIGKLKLSDTIALRLSSSQAPRLPILLRTASYNVFSSPTWQLAGNGNFRELPQTPDGWRLVETGHAESSMEILTTSPHLKTLIALPGGVTSVASATFKSVARNRMGSLQAVITPGQYSYRVRFDASNIDRVAPGLEDLALPRADGKILLELAHRLQLDGNTDQEKLKLVKAYFFQNFSYSTFRSGNAANHTAVSDFLQRNRSGHCEHFATATTLLLRAGGIPARYAVGFSVTEPARFGNGFVARHRHAHAWVSAWVDGAWQDFDTTPGTWTEQEEGAAPAWEALLDVWSWLLFQARSMRLLDPIHLAYGAGLVGLAWLAWKLGRRKGGFRLFALRRAGNKAGATRPSDENASALQRIEHLLAARGMARPQHEPLSAWLSRIGPQIGEEATACLRLIVGLHYRFRFGPGSPAAEDGKRLREACSAWLARFGQPGPIKEAARNAGE
jgi:hypothetical protein